MKNLQKRKSEGGAVYSFLSFVTRGCGLRNAAKTLKLEST